MNYFTQKLSSVNSGLPHQLNTLLSRIELCTLRQDRLDALHELQLLVATLSTPTYIVDHNFLRVLIELIDLYSIDIELCQLGTDILYRLFIPAADTDNSSSSNTNATIQYNHSFIQQFVSSNYLLNLISSLTNTAHSTIQYQLIQIMILLCSVMDVQVQSIVLSSANSVNGLTELLNSSNELIRQESILLIESLSRNNSQISQIVVFSNGLEYLYNIIKNDENLSICDDCVRLIYSLIGGNNTNRSMYIESQCIKYSIQLIQQKLQYSNSNNKPAAEHTIDYNEISESDTLDIKNNKLYGNIIRNTLYTIHDVLCNLSFNESNNELSQKNIKVQQSFSIVLPTYLNMLLLNIPLDIQNVVLCDIISMCWCNITNINILNSVQLACNNIQYHNIIEFVLMQMNNLSLVTQQYYMYDMLLKTIFYHNQSIKHDILTQFNHTQLHINMINAIQLAEQPYTTANDHQIYNYTKLCIYLFSHTDINNNSVLLQFIQQTYPYITSYLFDCQNATTPLNMLYLLTVLCQSSTDVINYLLQQSTFITIMLALVKHDHNDVYMYKSMIYYLLAIMITHNSSDTTNQLYIIDLLINSNDIDITQLKSTLHSMIQRHQYVQSQSYTSTYYNNPYNIKTNQHDALEITYQMNTLIDYNFVQQYDSVYNRLDNQITNLLITKIKSNTNNTAAADSNNVLPTPPAVDHKQVEQYHAQITQLTNELSQLKHNHQQLQQSITSIASPMSTSVPFNHHHNNTSDNKSYDKQIDKLNKQITALTQQCGIYKSELLELNIQLQSITDDKQSLLLQSQQTEYELNHATQQLQQQYNELLEEHNDLLILLGSYETDNTEQQINGNTHSDNNHIHTNDAFNKLHSNSTSAQYLNGSNAIGTEQNSNGTIDDYSLHARGSDVRDLT